MRSSPEIASQVARATMDFTKLSQEQILAFGEPCPEFEEALRTYKRHDFDWSDPTKVLATIRHMVGLMDQSDQKDPEVIEEVVEATARDGTSLPIKVLRSATNRSLDRPLIVLYFPGGMVLGSNTSMAPLARLLIKKFDVVVALPTYRVAPEHPFPTSFDDGWDTFSWIAENAVSTLRADPKKGFVVGGISSGGNISNVIAHLARDKALQPPITGVWLSCAGVRLAPQDADKLPKEYSERLSSRTQDSCINNVISSPEMAKLFQTSLKADENSHIFAPLTWPTGHANLPKTYAQICGMDGIRDESLVFDDMLKKQGVATRLDLYEGLPHTFWHQFKDLPQAKKWQKDTIEGFEWLLDV
ncbi:AB hydrolase superfamily protein B1A11.02 [Pseudocercospora fuligena]|uniref:AB hydrolase superfamily protein B1A11.02 n=1 Tax=Pseudocercospora fuligena TaxID=685502 RepID=A0A8H6RFK9_9PEZI|nr:AB hydrolase superfamily protein B1A11.02 [Pseudocercospora fuligena]